MIGRRKSSFGPDCVSHDMNQTPEQVARDRSLQGSRHGAIVRDLFDAIERDDLDRTPFDGKGGMGQMYALFGDSMDEVMTQRNEVLSASRNACGKSLRRANGLVAMDSHRGLLGRTVWISLDSKRCRKAGLTCRSMRSLGLTEMAFRPSPTKKARSRFSASVLSAPWPSIWKTSGA